MNCNKDISALAAFRLASRLAFPRLTGSAGEGRARRLIGEAMSDAGLTVSEEWFGCSDFPINAAARWALMPLAVLFVISALCLRGHHPAPAAAFAVIALASAVFIIRRAQVGLGGPTSSMPLSAANVVGRAPATESRLTVLLMAHYDSKSQAFPIWLRIVLYLAAVALAFVLGTAIPAAAALELMEVPAFFAPAIPPLSLVLLAVAVAMTFNTVGDRSMGALDNATGVGLVVEVAGQLARESLPGVAVIAVATGAEEIGLWGSKALLQAHRDDLDPARTMVINFDGCGAGQEVWLLTRIGLTGLMPAPGLVQHARDRAAALSIPLKRLWIPLGMATDLMPFIRAGYHGLDFIGPAGSSHTTRDRMDLANPQTLADCADLALAVIRARAKEQA